jgi:DnaJ family protein C protein 28
MDWGKLVEQKIREAQEAGDFDKLPRKGNLNLDEENGVPEDMRLAFHLLKSQGFAPEWIEQNKALRARLDEARQTIARAWLWYRAKIAQNPGVAERAAADDDWRKARATFETTLQALNREVFLHNLRVPSLQLQRRPLRASEEYQALGIRP